MALAEEETRRWEVADRTDLFRDALALEEQRLKEVRPARPPPPPVGCHSWDPL